MTSSARRPVTVWDSTKGMGVLGHSFANFSFLNKGTRTVLVTFRKRVVHFVPCKTMQVSGVRTSVQKITCLGLPGKKRVSPLPQKSGTVPGSNSENCARLILRTGVLRSGDARSF